ncbi:MBL fold metallo-hydrolase [Yinghuangia sp. ASG 101]|uniref:MBL fold metallo-hydrolase n=1 Tax=Yinghuangia sp. ASG 101 TaxID=2896848 RepID=UPI001E40FCC2|nr:MBL fold metallo-hydrolase [Yinghuangia sp. ASG 101]UGQ11786.1 MBL fold metallo-hydrolase [Yinghuangia sp. ASG 101]
MTAPGRTTAAPHTLEVADGVFAYVQPDGGWCVNNAGIVRDGSSAALVDTAATVARARALRTAVERLTAAPPEVLVNTHHHGDHFFGNQVFAPRSLVVAHELARVEMAQAGLGLTAMWPDVDWGEIDLTLPVLTFRDRITLHTGALRLELMHVGPAHTTNDVVVWVPERRVLFSGDVLLSGATPYCLMGSIEGSLRAVERLRGLGATTIVPGHGPIGGPELLDATRDYLEWVRSLARDGTAAGLTALEIARAADLGPFSELLDSERLVGNLHRACAELDARDDELGRPLDVVASFREMVEFHGRLPDCHA